MMQAVVAEPLAAHRLEHGQKRNAERTILAALVQSFLMLGVKHGLQPSELCAAAGVRMANLADADQQVPHAWFFAIRAALIERLPQVAAGIEIGTFVTPDQMGYVGQAIKYSPNGFEAMRLLMRGLRLVDSVYESYPLKFEVSGAEARLMVSCDALGPPDPPECVESLFVSCVHFLAQLTGRQVVPRAVWFGHARAEVVQRELAGFFRCQVQFGREEHALVLDVATLEAPCLHGDSEASRRYEEQVVQLLQGRSEPFITLVERQIAARLSTFAFSQVTVARALGMSARSLQRRLREHGVTYNGVLGTVRRQLAESMLLQSSAPVYEVAFRLGFDNVSSFNRAFRASTGQSPKAYRQKARPA